MQFRDVINVLHAVVL